MAAVKSVKAKINGQEYTLTYNSTDGTYQATITAPTKSSFNQSGGFYDVSVTADDVAGNTVTVNSTDETFGGSLKLYVKEKTAPVSTITYPTASALIANNKPTIKWTVTDDDSGVKADSIGIAIDNGTKVTGSAISKTAITGGYSCTYTPGTALSDGSHTIAVSASDNDGNAATTVSLQFKVDTTPPTLNVTAPANNDITNKSSCTVSGATNDLTSSPVTITVKLNSGTAKNVTVNSDGSFTTTVTLADGVNTITVTATDSAGKTTTITRTVTFDDTAPVIKTIGLTPNPVDAGKTYIITVKVE